MRLSGRAEPNVFLTGATGVLGARILTDLLRDTDVNITCLVRASSIADAFIRLEKMLRVYDPDLTLADDLRSRVQPLIGDIAAAQFGLEQEDFSRLTAETEVVIHCAANTNLFGRLSTARAINVKGTHEVINFTLATERRELLFVSTFTVMGDKTFDADFTLHEGDFDVGQEFPFMTYQQSKFEAEALVRQAGERGLNWQIVRPGQIFGDNTYGYYPQGETNVSGLFYDIFKTVIDTGVAFSSEVIFDVTPVDYVSKASIFFALKHRAFGETFHLTNPDERTYSEIIEMIRAYGYDIRFVSQDEYKIMLNERLLVAHGKEYRSATTQAFRCWFRHKSFDFTSSGRVDCSRARGILQRYEIHCKPIEDLIKVYLRRGIGAAHMPTLIQLDI
ncbi:MAG: thioester reductase domain-containing protein [Proteobacteria bacterium]|nr:thioester reductase domain-containing protein [Pseudomonadota bacterium]